jgi:hypothetical protein
VSVLHLTNGDLAAGRISAAGLPGDVLPWRDVLHEGPVPAGLDDDALRAARAEFLGGGAWSRDSVLRGLRERDARLGAASAEDEVVLWFEPDLYDQLQLVQILDLFAKERLEGLFLVQADDYLGQQEPEGIARLAQLRAGLSPAIWRAA